MNSSLTTLRSCSTYSIKSDKWCQIADLNVARYCVACTVFVGKVVVTGGDNNYEIKSVE